MALTQLILIEATRDTSFDIGYNVEVQHSRNQPFHGTVDALIYQKKDESAFDNPYELPIVPVLFSQGRKN